MSTILENAKRFRDQTIGMSRAEHIQWFGTKLGIDEAELLRLLGYAPGQILKQKAKGATFTELADAKPDQTVWVSELLYELADRSGYDWAMIARRLKESSPPGNNSTGLFTKSRTGTKTMQMARVETKAGTAI